MYHVLKFETIHAFVEEARKIDPKWSGEDQHSHRKSYQETVNMCLNGDLALVPKAEEILTRISRFETKIESLTGWKEDVVGVVPSVPAFLASHPAAMRTRTLQESYGVPKTLWVDLTSSAGVPNVLLELRGTLILALAMKLQETNPVQLELCTGSQHEGVCVISMDTAPFDLSVAAFFLCTGEAQRLPMYGVIRNKAKDYLGTRLSERGLREKLSISPLDLVITSEHLKAIDTLEKGLPWLEAQLEKALNDKT